MNGWAYSNNGLSFRGLDDPEGVVAGEVYFASEPTSGEISAAFPNYTAATAMQQNQAAYQGALGAGCQIVSAGTPVLSGTYGIGPQDEINLMGLQAGIAASAPWLGWYRDITGAKHVMTTAQFTPLAVAVLGYLEALDEAFETAQAAGVAMTLPAQPVDIA